MDFRAAPGNGILRLRHFLMFDFMKKVWSIFCTRNNAAKHLMKKIKKEYFRLSICIQRDALYAVETIIYAGRNTTGNTCSATRKQDSR